MTPFAVFAKRLLILPPVLLGIAILYWQAREREAPTLRPNTEIAHSVRIIDVSATLLRPSAEGFGSVQPARVWSAVAEVAGRVVEIHPELRNGVILPAGSPLLRIDPADYELAIAQSRAQMAELEVQESNARASLEIEQRTLALVERESERINKLVAQGTLSKNEADSATRNVLNARAKVQNLRNTLALIPAQRNNLQTHVARAERDLQQTHMVAPFAMRVAALAVEKDQFVSTGQTLFEGDSIDRVEVLAQFPMAQISNLVIGRTDLHLDVTRSSSQLSELIDFRPTVLLDTGQHIAQWEATFVRINDSIDPQTRTVGIIVAVDDPFGQVIPGLRPPLSKGMFVRVLMRGREQPKRILVPRSAIHNDSVVYIADSNNRLQQRSVEVAFQQADFSVINSGLQVGDRLILSDLVPVVEGMLLRPQLDADMNARIKATGEGS